MNTKDLVLENFKKLEAEGKKVLADCGWDGKEYYRHPNAVDYLRIRTEAMNLIRRACGEQSDHYQELKRLAESKASADATYYLTNCMGVIEAAHRDFESDLLFDLRSLISAELLGDFMTQAEVLLSNGYFIPAASLAGAVLEDSLCTFSEKKGITVPAKTKIDSLNSELARINAYDKLIQKRITALADIRNNADHGHFNKFTKEDVEDMVKWIGRFIADYLH